MAENIESSIQNLWQDVRELNLGATPHIDRLPNSPTPLQFLRHYVTPNKPCLISAAVPHWPALALWPSIAYLRTTLSTTPVSLHLTPTGKADALSPHPVAPSDLCFASAHVETVPFPEALDSVLASDDENKKVAYLQQQNDCFRREYGALAADCEEHVPWATEALGCSPEAVNLWVGNSYSETSFHKDHYENLYVVITGEKRFLLLPPTDFHRMYVREYPAATYIYHQDSGEFSLQLENPITKVPWCSVDPYPSPEDIQKEMEKFPLYFNGPKPFEVSVKAGEMLYLPSMWFHHVRQSSDDTGLTIAINYWYDMQFDIKYAYFNFLQSIPYTLPKHPALCESRNVSTDICSNETVSDGENNYTN
ncbi:2-oxoglutarate and oxygenase superfamily protein [Perilla frutescens var. hirtella]|nr:2-oxoglutarate and oxygenase superfamily protein [Perilla frutescens var. frutescens]KAH6792217.1 2-oxoglutarate and oxygenase superfamily protein [Perilla frutescens var. hirtella]